MPILSIDTTTRVATVAVVKGKDILAEVNLGVQKNHAERILPAVDFALRESGVKPSALKYIAIGAGPGSFTGLRIGMSLAKGLAEGLGIGVVPVSTIEVLAAQCSPFEGFVIPLLDAQREQYYAGVFALSSGGVTRMTDDQVIDKQGFPQWIQQFSYKPVLLTGEAAPLVGALYGLPYAASDILMPRAATLGLLAELKEPIDPKQALPNYIRSSSAQPRKGCV